MTIRFFILPIYCRRTVDFSNEALQAAGKGLQRLMEGLAQLDKLQAGAPSGFDLEAFRSKCYEALNDDLNTPILIAQLFEAVKLINAAAAGKGSFSEEELTSLRQLLHTLVFEEIGRE